MSEEEDNEKEEETELMANSEFIRAIKKKLPEGVSVQDIIERLLLNFIQETDLEEIKEKTEVERYIGKLRRRLAQLQNENKRLKKEVSRQVSGKREYKRQLQLARTQADTMTASTKKVIDKMSSWMPEMMKRSLESYDKAVKYARMHKELQGAEQAIEELHEKNQEAQSRTERENAVESTTEIMRLLDKIKGGRNQPKERRSEKK